MARFSKKRLLAAALLLGASGAAAASISIVATVNDDVITSTDLSERRALVMDASNVPSTEDNVKRLTPRILQGLIDEALELQEAKRQSVTVTESEIEKSFGSIAVRQKMPVDGFKKMLAAKGLSVRSLENQIRAQLAWGKVVQRKLRRNVTVSQDEVQRAALARAAAPGMREIKLEALMVPIAPQSRQEDVKKKVEEIANGLKSGQSLEQLAKRMLGKSDLQFNPPVWISEETMPAEVQRVLQGMQPGEVTKPFRTGNVIQFVEVLDRRVTKKLAGTTEVIIKQLSLNLPPKPDKTMQANITSTVETLRKDAGTCDSAVVPPTQLPVDVAFARPTVGALTPEQGNVLARLNVGEVSEPLVTENVLRLILLCERREPANAVPDTDAIQQDLFAEKMELEAQKHLRNLRRDASIDIREAK